MEAEVPHSTARKFSRGDALYSSLWRSAMQSLVLFLTFVVSYFQEQWGLLSFPFLSWHDDQQKVNFKKIWGKNPLKMREIDSKDNNT